MKKIRNQSGTNPESIRPPVSVSVGVRFFQPLVTRLKDREILRFHFQRFIRLFLSELFT